MRGQHRAGIIRVEVVANSAGKNGALSAVPLNARRFNLCLWRGRGAVKGVLEPLTQRVTAHGISDCDVPCVT